MLYRKTIYHINNNHTISHNEIQNELYDYITHIEYNVKCIECPINNK